MDCLVICTRNRSTDLKKCLESIAQLTQFPAMTLVVDSSTDNLTKMIVESMDLGSQIPNLKYARSDERGLTVARNVALEYALAKKLDFIHFIDDDVELDPNYICEIMNGFKANEELVGAGGTVMDTLPRPINRLRNILGLYSQKSGRVLWTGINIGSSDSDTEIEMDWLPGCSMSFRLGKVSNIRFDVRRAIWPMGEDVDFGLKASALGQLLHLPKARLQHHMSLQNRDDEIETIFQDIIHRWTLADDKLGRVRKIGVIWSGLAMAWLYFMSYTSSRSNFDWRRAKISIWALWVCLVQGGLDASFRK